MCRMKQWAEDHRRHGHHPHPAPTAESGTVDCACGALWRILTLEQIEKKFAHLKR
jgi:hypothetical protein